MVVVGWLHTLHFTVMVHRLMLISLKRLADQGQWIFNMLGAQKMCHDVYTGNMGTKHFSVDVTLTPFPQQPHADKENKYISAGLAFDPYVR